LPARVSWNFQEPYPDFLADWGQRVEGSLEAMEVGLKVNRRPMADASEFAVGFEIVSEITGDFEITLDYRDFKSKTFAKDWRIPRIDISGKVYDPSDLQSPANIFGIAHRRETNDAMKAAATHGDRRQDGNQDWRYQEVRITRDSGQLRLVRQKTWLFYQTAPLETDDWTTISCRAVNPGPFKEVGLGLRAEDLEGSGEAVLLNLTIRAGGLKSK